MACCVFAAFLFAQCALLLKRWGRFWCVLPKDETCSQPNAMETLRGWVKKPIARLVLVFLLSCEAVALGIWIADDHGGHFAALVQQFFNNGEENQVIYTADGGAFVYTTLCTSDGQKRQILTSIQ